MKDVVEKGIPGEERGGARYNWEWERVKQVSWWDAFFRGVLVEASRWSDGVEGECLMTVRENLYGVGFPWTVS